MELKIFGKNLFEIKKYSNNPISAVQWATDMVEKSECLPDFYSIKNRGQPFDVSSWGATTAISSSEIKKEELKVPKKTKSPKELYNLRMLDNTAFQIKVDEKYVDEQISSFTEKLNLIKLQEAQSSDGILEVAGILIRMKNRKKYPQFKDFYNDFPYTTTERMKALVKEHDHLQIGEISQFIADMPTEAISVMKSYSKKTKELCGKNAVYYLIAKKEEFKQTEHRANKRDPILLAQSPFGNFWQILGAWDEEMLLVDEL